MSKPIKTREVIKDIKTLDKKRAMTDGTRTAYAKTREITEQGAKGTVKTAGKSIKTAEKTARTTVKTTQQATRGAKATIKATQVAARNSTRAARMIAKVAATTARFAARAIAAFVKMTMAAVKSLVVAIAAGDWVAVVVILIICLIALVATSAFGIFFTGDEKIDGNPSLREVVFEVNEEYNEKTEEIKTANTYDELSLVGTRTKWKEVLAVFAVKTTTDPNNPLDVVTLDEKRQKFLREIFWDMNTIESRIEEQEGTEIVLEEDKDGIFQETTKTDTVKTLYITLSSKKADQVAASSSQSSVLFTILV